MKLCELSGRLALVVVLAVAFAAPGHAAKKKYTETEVANQFIGTIVTTIDTVELGVELPEGGFGLGG